VLESFCLVFHGGYSPTKLHVLKISRVPLFSLPFLVLFLMDGAYLGGWAHSTLCLGGCDEAARGTGGAVPFAVPAHTVYTVDLLLLEHISFCHSSAGGSMSHSATFSG